MRAKCGVDVLVYLPIPWLLQICPPTREGLLDVYWQTLTAGEMSVPAPVYTKATEVRGSAWQLRQWPAMGSQLALLDK
jgi:hypothetical protein